MRRPGKASQLAKRRNRAGMYELNRSIIAWTSNVGSQAVIILDKKTMTERMPTENLHWAVDRLDHHWSMCIVAVGIEPNGRVNFHPYELDPNTEDNPGPHNHKNLVEAFNHAHQFYLNKINPKFERGAMWMASLEQIDYSDADLEKIWSLR